MVYMCYVAGLESSFVFQLLYVTLSNYPTSNNGIEIDRHG